MSADAPDPFALLRVAMCSEYAPQLSLGVLRCPGCAQDVTLGSDPRGPALFHRGPLCEPFRDTPVGEYVLRMMEASSTPKGGRNVQ